MTHHDETLAELNKAIKQNPQNAKAFAHRAEFYRQMKCYSEALTDFNRAIDFQPDYAWAMAHRGVTYRRLMRYEDALADFNRAIDLKSDYAWAIAYRGVIYVIMGRYQDAVAEYNRAVALDATLINHWGNERGFPLLCLGEYAQAIECYKQTLTVRRDDAMALYCLAVTQAHWQGLAKAQTQINQARIVLQSMVDTQAQGFYGRDAAFYGLGGLAALKGETKLALNYLQEVILLEADPNIEMVRHDPAWRDLRANPRFQALMA